MYDNILFSMDVMFLFKIDGVNGMQERWLDYGFKLKRKRLVDIANAKLMYDRVRTVKLGEDDWKDFTNYMGTIEFKPMDFNPIKYKFMGLLFIRDSEECIDMDFEENARAADKFYNDYWG